MATYYIQGTEEGQRLDRFLNDKLLLLSRNQIQKLIDQGRVTVNDHRVKTHHFLRKKDRIEVATDDRPRSPSRAAPAERPNVAVLAEDVNFLVIDKPSNLLVHPAPGRNDYTLAAWLKDHDATIVSVGEDPSRAGLVQRLDEDVSGVMVVAKTNAAFSHLKDQFGRRVVKKTYLALVHGTMEKPDGVIDFPIARSERHGWRMAARPHSQADGAREAVTRYTVLEQFQHYALLKVEPETGRTNQIRVHLNAINHPVVGDPIYRPKHLKATATPGRIFLHATSLAFHDLSGAKRSYESPLPSDLQAFLDRQRGKTPAALEQPAEGEARHGRPAEKSGLVPIESAMAQAGVDTLKINAYDDLALYEFTHAPQTESAEASNGPAEPPVGDDRPRPPKDQGR